MIDYHRSLLSDQAILLHFRQTACQTAAAKPISGQTNNEQHYISHIENNQSPVMTMTNAAINSPEKNSLGMNNLSPKKLLNSKWTAVKPLNKEKHFLITDVEYDENGTVIHCELEAIMSNRCTAITWRDLKDSNQWIQGWS